MARIRFTLGESSIWHEVQLDYYELTNQAFRDEHDLSYIIKKEQELCKSSNAKKVEVLDDEGNILAQSSNILESGKLEYVNKK